MPVTDTRDKRRDNWPGPWVLTRWLGDLYVMDGNDHPLFIFKAEDLELAREVARCGKNL